MSSLIVHWLVSTSVIHLGYLKAEPVGTGTFGGCEQWLFANKNRAFQYFEQPV